MDVFICFAVTWELVWCQFCGHKSSERGVEQLPQTNILAQYYHLS
ncbi:hypothetical protein GLYMA_10G172950v4 [Glycine max]|nr:hypothetical protein GLYMA_10G172950v4 [Glycine max]KAH1138743.1 hypothetical protein GYH30_028288 [Glycine max]